MSGNNAPNAVNQPPFPNVHLEFNGRVKVHVMTCSLAAGTPTLITTESTPGVAVSTPGQGRLAITFPAPGTGAIGWAVVAAPKQAAASDFTYQAANAATNIATGTLEIQTLTAGAVQNQTAAGFTVFIYVFGP